MSQSMYVMVSVPEAKPENVYASPIILGVFDSKEGAQAAWKARGPEFRDIKAKTVHKYVETFLSEGTELPQFLWLWATYYVYGCAKEQTPRFVFFPYNAGFFETYEDCCRERNRVWEMNPISQKQFCETSGFVFYASNEDIVEKMEVNRLVRIPVMLTEKNGCAEA